MKNSLLHKNMFIQNFRVGQEDLVLQEIPEGLGFQVFQFFLGVLEDQEVLVLLNHYHLDHLHHLDQEVQEVQEDAVAYWLQVHQDCPWSGQFRS